MHTGMHTGDFFLGDSKEIVSSPQEWWVSYNISMIVTTGRNFDWKQVPSSAVLVAF